MEPLYRQIIKKAWGIIWHHKFLWFFGFFASLVGAGGEFSLLFQSFYQGTREGTNFPLLQNLINIEFFKFSSLGNFLKFFWTDSLGAFLALLVAAVILMIVLLVIWLVIVSQSAIIDATSKISLETKRKINVGLAQGIKVGWKNFVPVFGLNVLTRVFIYLFLLIIGLPFIYSNIGSSALWQFISYLLAFLILVPLAIIISFIAKYAMAYVILKKLELLEAISGGLKLFYNNWLISLEMALILFIINVIINIVSFLALLLLAMPFVLLAAIFFWLGSALAFWLVIISGVILVSIILLFVRTIFTAFVWSTWTLLFTKLAKGEAISKIVRLSNSFSNYFLKS